MRIPNITFANTLVSQLQQLTSQQNDAQNQIATGQRITDPSDDPAATARVMEYQSEQQQLQQFSRNNDRATNVSQASFTAMNSLKSLSDRAGEITVLGSGTAGPDALAAYGTETNQMIEQALQTANSQYSGEHLFGGTKTDTPPFAATRDASGQITGVTYNGAASGAQIRTGEGSTMSPFTTGTENQQLADFMNHLVSLRNALQSGDAGAVQATDSPLQTDSDHFVTTLSDIGATQTRLQADSTQNQARFSELQKLSSTETSVDISQAAVRLSQAQTSYQAALQSGAKMLQMSLLDYLH